MAEALLPHHLQRWGRFASVKVSPPHVAPFEIERSALTRRPFSATRTRIVTVCAPAGFGKTTLLRQWHAAFTSAESASIWVSLDVGDNLPSRFLAALESGIDRSVSSFGTQQAASAESEPDNKSFADRLAEMLTRVIDVGRPTTVFLDNFHVIREEQIHRDISALLDFLPNGLSLVVAARTEPLFQLSRLRLRGAVEEFTMEDLAFSGSEASDFFEALCPRFLSTEQIELLNERTNGWIAGLHMAALSVRVNTSARELMALSGTRSDIAAYFLENVIADQPDDVREFLYRTSLLASQDASLCDFACEITNSQSILERLQRQRLFLSQSSDRPGDYRYNNLFAEFLRSRMEAEQPADARAIHSRASVWYEQRREWECAIRHAYASHERARAAELITRRGRELFRQASFRELDDLLRESPTTVVETNATLSILHAWALAYLGELRDATRKIAHVRKNFRLDGAACNENSVVAALVDIIRTDEPVDELPAHLADSIDDDAVRGIAYIAIGYAQRAKGKFAESMASFQHALAQVEHESSFVFMLARFNIAALHAMAGRPRDGQRALEDTLVSAERFGWREGLATAFVRVQLTAILTDQNRLDEAAAYLEPALVRLRAGQAYGFLGVALAERGRIALAKNDTHEAAASLREAREIADTHSITRVAFRVGLIELLGAISQNSLRVAELAERLNDEFGVDSRAASMHAGERVESLLAVRACVLSATDHAADAIRLVKGGLESAMRANRLRSAAIFLAAHGRALWELGDHERAIRKLDQGLSLAPNSVRAFLWAGRGLVPLLRALQQRERHVGEIAAILAAFEDSHGSVAGSQTKKPDLLDLHIRERQILGLIAKGLRTREIAADLGISPETVKWYLKSMFTKLNVRTRAQAVDCGRRLEILV